jgi:hypothetical protein
MLCAAVAATGAIVAFALRYPILAAALSIITLGIVLVIGGLLALLAEAMLEDWLAAKLNSEQKPHDSAARDCKSRTPSRDADLPPMIERKAD